MFYLDMPFPIQFEENQIYFNTIRKNWEEKKDFTEVFFPRRLGTLLGLQERLIRIDTKVTL